MKRLTTTVVPPEVTENRERWRVIGNFPDYAISDKGRVMRITESVNTYPGYIFKGSLSRKGYPRVCLSRYGKTYTIEIHKLVLENFVGLRPEGKQANHKNGVKIENTIENLEWTTPSENVKHAFTMGLKTNKGEINPASKLTWKEVEEIRHLCKSTNMSLRKIGTLFRVTKSTIFRVKHRKNWR